MKSVMPISVLFHPLTGRLFNENTMSYHFLLAGNKVAECSIDVVEKEGIGGFEEICKLIWDEIFDRVSFE